MANTIEPLLNGELASILRERGFESAAEQTIRAANNRRHQVDVLVDLDDRVVAIEAEFEPAHTLRQDAAKRLPLTPLRWKGVPIESVFEVVYPAELQRMDDGKARKALRGCTLAFEEVTRTARGQIKGGVRQEGNVGVLAETLHDYWVRHTQKGVSIDEAVDEASRAIQEAVESLEKATTIPPSPEGEETLAAMALVWLDAFLFQELLVANLDREVLEQHASGTTIPVPASAKTPAEVVRQWEEILAINWWPIFSTARSTLRDFPAQWAQLALEPLRNAASSIAARREIRQHDIAGRIYHRLLSSRKFLATNYTTIPAAVVLAGLAFDPMHPRWKDFPWDDPDAVRDLRIVDVACGTGTLLMAALQEILRKHRQSMAEEHSAETTRELVRLTLENALIGYDVVPGAVHLTAATLSMAESSQIIKRIPITRMPHDVHRKRARLGSLDFLKSAPGGGKAQALPLFPEHGDASQRTGTGEEDRLVNLPTTIDLAIANPPYTRAGGPGSDDNTSWNPLFGSVLSKRDANLMRRTLKEMLSGTPASLYAGLGSAFLVLADENLGAGGRLAFVLQGTVMTGSRWEPIRELLLDKYDLEWVIASHDARSRAKKSHLPGRFWVSFSESTRIAEVLIVATKLQHGKTARGMTRFVNLRHNVDDPSAAIALTRSLLAAKSAKSPTEVVTGEKVWGEITPIRQSQIPPGPWIYTSFVQGRLIRASERLIRRGTVAFDGEGFSIPITPLEQIAELGPYHMQIKNPTQGLFDIVATDDPTRAGHPALWHHKSTKIVTLEVTANARLTERGGKDKSDQRAMLEEAGRLHLTAELRHAPQRLAAVITEEPMLGVRSWITVSVGHCRPGEEEALCLWFNSTVGVLLRIASANRPYLGRSATPHEGARKIPVLNVKELTSAQLRKARVVFRELKEKPLSGFAHLAEDSVRRDLDRRLAGDVLGAPAKMFDRLARALNQEPTMTARH